MNRRGFLGTLSGVVSASAIVPEVTALADQPPRDHRVVDAPRHRVHHLGPPLPKTPWGRLIGGLSEDVFDRLCQAVEGRDLMLSDMQRVGEARVIRGHERLLTDQFHTAVRLSSAYMSDRPPEFPLDAFRAATNTWVSSQALFVQGAFYRCGEVEHAPVGAVPIPRDLFAPYVVVGMPVLPNGSVEWASHYVDERSGIAMRVVIAYDFLTDDFILRCDVLVG